MTEKLTKQSLKETAFSKMSPTRIGNAKETLIYLEKHFGITTQKELEVAMEDCLVIERRGNIYYNNSQC